MGGMTPPEAATPIDLLVFGPHPDDIEIGMGATVARHVELGLRVGLCDLTAGEMGSNGTVEERLAEADAAGEVLGAAWRVNLRWPDRRIGGADQMRSAVALIRRVAPAHGRDSLLVRPPSRSRRLQPGAHRGGIQQRPAPLRARARRVEAGARLLLLHQRLGDALVRHRRVGAYEVKRRALACYMSQFRPSGARSGGDAPDVATLPATRRKP